MRIASLGSTVFAASLVAIGLWGLIAGGFAGVWETVPRSWPAREAIGHICALVALATGAGLLWRRTAGAAAAVLLVWLLAWMLAIKAAPILAAPLSAVSWESWGETAVLVAAWVLFAELAGAGRGGLSGETGVRIGRAVFGVAMLAFGWSHFAYAGPTSQLVPHALPAHLGWVYFTGLAYVAAGLAILSGVCARLAAALSAMQMGVFTLLIWVPVIASGAAGASDRSETIISWALTAAGWVVADSYRSGPWLSHSGRRSALRSRRTPTAPRTPRRRRA